ncbi:11S globulin seed storage protein 2, partial [Bienertia sinuspersici]
SRTSQEGVDQKKVYAVKKKKKRVEVIAKETSTKRFTAPGTSDVLAILPGSVHWCCNDGNKDFVAINVNDLNNPSNLLDQSFRSRTSQEGVDQKKVYAVKKKKKRVEVIAKETSTKRFTAPGTGDVLAIVPGSIHWQST